MAHVSHKLSNAFEGALAGGGDPATSPLYVFGPFLRLIVVAGVAQITFGASIWLVILTVALVSAMYRLVMIWVVDGSGGSGLTEEEFGGWAVKINAGITFLEYTLTFLVSMAALVTFIADRIPVLNEPFLGFQYRTFVAIFLSIGTGWLVNRGPKMAARAFGPATAGVLLLLWIMIISTIIKFGIKFPDFNLEAFNSENLRFTLGGYVRILALMTGIEIFANLVAAYDGKPREKSRKAFYSLLIIMGTTSMTMLIVGPAIAEFSDPTNETVSVFTQTMDQLLPGPLALVGTIVSVAVLLSASAASAQGLQNLALGLKLRHYVPTFLGQRNIYDVADKPVWIEVAVVSICFLFLGTSEETYLAVYAAGVFILLSMTGWAVSKRLIGFLKTKYEWRTVGTLAGTVIAASLTTVATIIIFIERFSEGAWSYFILLPALYVLFSYFRSRLGNPTPYEERLGLLVKESKHLLVAESTKDASLNQVMITLDGSEFSESAIPAAVSLCRSNGANLTLLSVNGQEKVLTSEAGRKNPSSNKRRKKNGHKETLNYLAEISKALDKDNIKSQFVVGAGDIADEISRQAQERSVDVLVMSTHGHTGAKRLLTGSIANNVTQKTTIPLLLVRPDNHERPASGSFKKLLVAMGGSKVSEQVLPYVKTMARIFDSEIILLSVPEDLESPNQIKFITDYLEDVAASLNGDGLNAKFVVDGTDPARMITKLAESESVDLIMMATHGRGRLDRLMLGSVADIVIKKARCPVFLVPVHDRP